MDDHVRTGVPALDDILGVVWRRGACFSWKAIPERGRQLWRCALPVPRSLALSWEEKMRKGLSDVARSKIELMNLIRDLENKVADANRALDRTRDLLRQLERATPEPHIRAPAR